MSSTPSTGPAQRRYGSGTVEREPVLARARRISALTIPSLFRESGANDSTSTVLPWSSFGAYCVNNFSAKNILAMYPPGTPFIKLKASKEVLAGLQELEPTQRGDLKAEMDKGLSKVEMEFIEGVEEDGDRWRLFDAMRHMAVGGNHCLKVSQDAILQSISLENYVTWRNKRGDLLEFVIEDGLTWETLDEDLQEHARQHGYEVEYEEGGNKEPKAVQKPIKVYTHGFLKKGQWTVYQELCGATVDGTKGTFTPDAMPYLFLRMIALEGENYGRSYCEDYEADLQTLDGFWQILTEGAAAAALLKWLIKAGGTVNKKAFDNAQNGQSLTGEEGDVYAVRADKGGDSQAGLNLMDRVENRLAKVFLLYSSVQRQGERVTREEIITIRQDLEAALGGVYSNQVTTFQAPYARLKLQALQRQKRVTKLPKGSTTVTILTGDAALGRMQAGQTLDEFLGSAKALLGDASVAEYISVSNYLSRAGANKAIDTDGLVRSQEEVDANRQAMQQQALSHEVAPEVVKQAGGMIQNEQSAQIAEEQQQAQPA